MMLIILRSLAADFRTFKLQIVNSQSRGVCVCVCACTLCVCVVAQVIKLISLCHPTIQLHNIILLYQTILVHQIQLYQS